MRDLGVPKPAEWQPTGNEINARVHLCAGGLRKRALIGGGWASIAEARLESGSIVELERTLQSFLCPGARPKTRVEKWIVFFNEVRFGFPKAADVSWRKVEIKRRFRRKLRQERGEDA